MVVPFFAVKTDVVVYLFALTLVCVALFFVLVLDACDGPLGGN